MAGNTACGVAERKLLRTPGIIARFMRSAGKHRFAATLKIGRGRRAPGGGGGVVVSGGGRYSDGAISELNLDKAALEIGGSQLPEWYSSGGR